MNASVGIAIDTFNYEFLETTTDNFRVVFFGVTCVLAFQIKILPKLFLKSKT